jgi:hypothetical protein
MSPVGTGVGWRPFAAAAERKPDVWPTSAIHPDLQSNASWAGDDQGSRPAGDGSNRPTLNAGVSAGQDPKVTGLIAVAVAVAVAVADASGVECSAWTSARRARWPGAMLSVALGARAESHWELDPREVTISGW